MTTLNTGERREFAAYHLLYKRSVFNTQDDVIDLFDILSNFTDCVHGDVWDVILVNLRTPIYQAAGSHIANYASAILNETI